MIQANELRVGNWVESSGQIKQINGINGSQNAFYDFNGIPLTKDILLKCGFEKSGGSWRRDEVIIYTHEIDDLTYHTESIMSEGGIEIKSLHQLQNLYYALTGKELEVNLK